MLIILEPINLLLLLPLLLLLLLLLPLLLLLFLLLLLLLLLPLRTTYHFICSRCLCRERLSPLLLVRLHSRHYWAPISWLGQEPKEH